jgi:tetratricopeptide (TPR) repeat protein
MITQVNNNINPKQANVGIPEDQKQFQQGQTFFDQGNFIGAWHCFNEAIKINPQELYFLGRCSAAEALEDHNAYRALIAEYNKNLEWAQNNGQIGNQSWIHFDLGCLYAELDDDNTALTHMVTAARLGHTIARSICSQYGIPY